MFISLCKLFVWFNRAARDKGEGDCVSIFPFSLSVCGIALPLPSVVLCSFFLLVAISLGFSFLACYASRAFALRVLVAGCCMLSLLLFFPFLISFIVLLVDCPKDTTHTLTQTREEISRVCNGTQSTQENK